MTHQTTNRDFGPLGPAAVNYVIEQLLLQVAAKVANLRPRDTRASVKFNLDRPQGNIVMPADTQLQRLLVSSLRHLFPGIGVIAEEPKERERDYRIKSSIPGGRQLSVTIDPIDGSKMLAEGIRRFVGTTVALVEELPNGTLNVLGSWIINLCTGELFSAPIGTKQIWRTFHGQRRSLLKVPRDLPFAQGRILARSHPELHPPLIRRLLTEVANGGVFRHLVIHRGSISLIMAEELASGEVLAVVTEPYAETPWDEAPFRELLRRAGFVYLRVNPNGTDFVHVNNPLRSLCFRRNHFGLWIHESRVADLNAAARLIAAEPAIA